MPLPTSLSHVYVKRQSACSLPKSFFEGRFPINAHPDSLDYQQWWIEQIRRCREGWTDGGYTFTPAYYYHTNFKKINLIDPKTELLSIDHPYFSFEDQQLFQDFVTARAEKKGIFLVTGRGMGKSYAVSSVVEHTFTFFPATECIISASTDKFADLLWEKLQLGLNTQPSEIRLSMLEDTRSKKYSGYKVRNPLTRQEREEGFKSVIRKVVYDSDPEKTRGTRPAIHVFEEVGSWTGAAKLIDCYKKTEPSWWRGKFKTTLPIFIGTGGAMDTGGSANAKIMFNAPDLYDLLAFDWDGQKIGKFIPAYCKFGGFYEESGESDKVGAKAELDDRRNKKKADPDLFRQISSELPYNPKEAFQVSGGAVFPVEELEARFLQIQRDPLLTKIVQKGKLNPIYNSGGKLVDVEWEQDPEGIFEIAEHPPWRDPAWKEGEIANLYISGCDSFDAVAEEINEERKDRKSPGSCIMFKRFYKAGMTSRFFVAKITQRTEDADDFYFNALKLNMYYRSKMLAEYTKIGIFRYFISNNFEHMLYKRPRLDSTVVKESTSTNTYGIAMPVEVKKYIITKFKQWVKPKPTVSNLDQMYFLSLILDMIDFTFDGMDKNKHDETMAAAIALLGDEDMYKVTARSKESSSVHFPRFVRDAKGKLVFK